MMSFRDIEIKTEYRSGKSDVIKDFYIPVLSRAVKYKRAVGFFSSTALIQIAKGISEMVVNGGHLTLYTLHPTLQLHHRDSGASSIGVAIMEGDFA